MILRARRRGDLQQDRLPLVNQIQIFFHVRQETLVETRGFSRDAFIKKYYK
jgi:hypothetical protein